METRNDLQAKTISTSMTQAGATTSTQRSTSDSDRAFVNGLFRSLQAIFPAWRQAFADDAAINEAKRQWSLGLIEANLTSVEAIKAGLAKARKSKNPFLPSVGMFIDWCHEAVRDRLNFPSLDAVILQVSQYSHHRRYPNPRFVPEIHPVAYWIYQHVDTFAVSRAEEREARRLVGIAYAEASEKAAQGYVFDSPPQLLPEEAGAGAPMTPEQVAAAAKARAEIRSMLGLKA